MYRHIEMKYKCNRYAW